VTIIPTNTGAGVLELVTQVRLEVFCVVVLPFSLRFPRSVADVGVRAIAAKWAFGAIDDRLADCHRLALPYAVIKVLFRFGNELLSPHRVPQ
jgi:hypothetical protein